jgi:hypothetical protein
MQIHKTNSRFLTETLKAMRAWNDVFSALKENKCQPILLYSAKEPSIIEGEIKAFHPKQKLIIKAM